MKIDNQTVIKYLLNNPDFFIHNANFIEQIRIPHPVQGAISLVEWYMISARNQINKLEENIILLTKEAINNEYLFYNLLHLQRKLILATNLDNCLNIFNKWTLELGLKNVVVRLFSDCWNIKPSSNFYNLLMNRQQFEPLRIQYFKEKHHYLGPISKSKLSLISSEVSSVGSVAISILGCEGNLGIILFVSHDINHYKQDQDTQLLSNIAQILPEILEKWIERI